MSLASYFKLRKSRSTLKSAIKQTTSVYNMQRDIAGEASDVALRALLVEARNVYRTSRDIAVIEAMVQNLAQAIGKDTAWRPLHVNSFAENFDVIVVAVGVAMAFRCYFFEPFKIPTGSMQPTLYGIYSTEQAKPGLFDRMPLKPFKWIVTGDWYKEVRVGVGGAVQDISASFKPGYVTYTIAGHRYHVPSDVLEHTEAGSRDPNAPMNFIRKHCRVRHNERGVASYYVPAGEVLWAGIVHAGDHVFVNRVVWNFRKPHRGEVMVFSTTGIKGLVQDTHYIKRMVGLPGESIGVNPPELIVNGQPVSEPYTIGRIARKDSAYRYEGNYTNYLGYMLIGDSTASSRSPLRKVGDEIQLSADEYLGMGDNTGNSLDGRYWGAVPAKNLLGPGAFVYWPFTSKRFGIIH